MHEFGLVNAKSAKEMSNALARAFKTKEYRTHAKRASSTGAVNLERKRMRLQQQLDAVRTINAKMLDPKTSPEEQATLYNTQSAFLAMAMVEGLALLVDCVTLRIPCTVKEIDEVTGKEERKPGHKRLTALTLSESLFTAEVDVEGEEEPEEETIMDVLSDLAKGVSIQNKLTVEFLIPMLSDIGRDRFLDEFDSVEPDKYANKLEALLKQEESEEEQAEQAAAAVKRKPQAEATSEEAVADDEAEKPMTPEDVRSYLTGKKEEGKKDGK